MELAILSRYKFFFNDNITSAYTKNELKKEILKFDEELNEYCTAEKRVFRSYRLLKKIQMDLLSRQKDCCLASNPVYREIIEELSRIITIELDVTLLKIQHPETLEMDNKINFSTKLQWTDTKAALVELLYSIPKSLNNGKAKIKDIASCFEFVFQIDLGNYSDILDDINMRKTGQTKYLDSLSDNLKKVLDKMCR